MIVYDDNVCKIEITSADFPGCYLITLDNDVMKALVEGLDEAKDVAEAMRDKFVEENGQFGVGA